MLLLLVSKEREGTRDRSLVCFNLIQSYILSVCVYAQLFKSTGLYYFLLETIDPFWLLLQQW